MPALSLLQGDALAVLKTLPSDSVHCCVTSPPYYGLRDYGTASWEGGDAGCDHKQGRNGAGRADGIVDERGQRNRDGVGSMGGDCGKCGARRIDRQIGLEPDLETYLSRLVAVFAEVRRVLHPSGMCFVNMGDSYAGHNLPGWRAGNEEKNGGASNKNGIGFVPGLKPKDRLLVPFRLALLLQADGWWVRDIICWAKRAPMPESVTDRCTQSWEPIFMLTKASRYYWDAEAVKEATGNHYEPQENAEDVQPLFDAAAEGGVLPEARRRDRARLSKMRGKPNARLAGEEQSTLFAGSEAVSPELRRQGSASAVLGISEREGSEAAKECKKESAQASIDNDAHGSALGGNTSAAPAQMRILPSDQCGINAGPRNTNQQGRESHEGKRGACVSPLQQSEEGQRASRNLRNFWLLSPSPYPDAHFATFVPEIPKRCILAGTSAKGVCPKCGEPWVRRVEQGPVGEGYTPGETPAFQVRRFASATPGFTRETKTIGWSPGCACGNEPVPATVLDPFAGSGTTLAVALDLGRNAIGIELSPEYVKLAQARCAVVTPGLALA